MKSMKWKRIRGKYKKSLHIRLILILLAVGIAPLAVIGRLLVYSSRENHIRSRMTELQYQSVAVVSELEERDYLSNMSQPVLTAEIDQLARFYRGRIILVDSDYRIRKDTYHLAEGKYNISEEVLSCFGGSNTARYDEEGQYLELSLPVSGKDGTVKGVMVITASMEFLTSLQDQLEDQRRTAVIIGGLLVAVASFFLSELFVRPVKKVARAIDSSSQDSVGSDIQLEDCAETVQIAQAYNRMLARLRTLDESRQQFVSNVSHELKTPITSIRVLADSLIGQEEAPVELYREFMSDISAEIDRESQIIDDLLAMVRLDKANAELNISGVNINEMMESILKRLRPLAMKRNVELVLESFRPVQADADEVKLNLAVTNLVENAIKYNVDNGWVRVSLNADHQFFYIKVADSGIGIPEKEWDHIFERFYRVDKARSRATGGTGLGLAITKNIISLHHGAVRVHSAEGEGTTFTVRIPLTYRRQEGEV